jgi:hypothetical protein
MYSASYDNSVLAWGKHTGVSRMIVEGPENPSGLLRTIDIEAVPKHEPGELAYSQEQECVD